MCRKIRKTLESGHHPNKGYMIFAIMEMAGDGEDEEEERESEEYMPMCKLCNTAPETI